MLFRKMIGIILDIEKRKGVLMATLTATQLINLIETTLAKNNINYLEYINQFGQVQAVHDRNNGKTFAFDDHIRGLILSKLSSQRLWKPISDNLENIRKIFLDFNPEQLLRTDPQYFVDSLKSIQCGNRNINKQMAVLSENIFTMRKIIQKFGSMDKFITSDDPIGIAIQ